MTTQDSESELAGRLGASLTPRVPRITVQQRVEQNSGLFDVGALYAASVEQVMRRARVAQPPVFGIAGVAQPAPVALPSAWGANAARVQRVQQEEIDLDLFLGRSRGVGWFGVAVAWMATTALGATIATTVPAHTLARGHASAPVVAATAPAAITPATAAAAFAAPPPVVSAPPAEAPSVAVAAAPAVAPKKAIIVTHARTRPVPASGSAAVTPAPQPQKVASVEAPPAPKAAVASAPPAAAGGASLEELMRRAVEADAKKH
ncbi:MAG: hypothetical protein ACLP1X_18705 [Polyangiaceae bacterium]|jgi:hypothetical protein